MDRNYLKYLKFHSFQCHRKVNLSKLNSRVLFGFLAQLQLALSFLEEWY
jgi:hypothetical protein